MSNAMRVGALGACEVVQPFPGLFLRLVTRSLGLLKRVLWQAPASGADTLNTSQVFSCSQIDLCAFCDAGILHQHVAEPINSACRWCGE
jgi:hypothetical protein